MHDVCERNVKNAKNLEDSRKFKRHVLKQAKTRRYTAIKRQSLEIVKSCKHGIKYAITWRKAPIKRKRRIFGISEYYCHRTTHVNRIKQG